MSDITKTKDDSITKPFKIGAKSALAQRLEQAKAKKAEKQVVDVAVVSTLPNRIGMMLDVSGSMTGEPLDQLKVAAKAFLDACDAANTAVAVNTFEPTIHINLSNTFDYHKIEIQALPSTGGTPMGEAMEDMLLTEPITRGVLVSDGDATGTDPLRVARNYKEAGVPIDCVHIGESVAGTETLKAIAGITGGMYMKFKDIHQFAHAFKYLTPAYRALLADPEMRKRLGAS